MAAAASMAAAAVTKSAPAVKSPRRAAARESSPAKIAIVTEPTVIVMPEHVNIRPPDIPIEAWAIIRPIPTRPAVAIVTVTRATAQNREQQQAYPQPLDAA
jgi:hypothetical protein